MAAKLEAPACPHIPVVTIHVAQSLDGRIALAGSKTSLSTEEGERAAHRARAENDAVLVGAETVRIDDPRLTIRHRERHADGPDPLRVVLASDLEVPPEARIFGATPERVLVLGAEGRATEAARRRLVERGAGVAIVTATTDGLVSLEAAMAVLADRGVERLLVEGGARVLTSFFRARRVDHVEIEIAMRLLGAPATPSLGACGIAELEDAPELANVVVERLGASVLVRADVVFPPSSRGRAP